ncbi:MAG TPA: helix-turn-helix transcriptional regulator [Arenicellales bacterium]|nr:helix-turn-helix transcriptional regulator [Arenicellales bacterium]
MDDVTMHPLRAWREQNGVSLRQLADRLRGDDPEPLISYASLGRIERGLQPPSWAVLERLHEVTEGQVTPNDFIGAVEPARQA